MKEGDRCTRRLNYLIEERLYVGSHSAGRCTEECIPGLVVCHKHATRGALLLMIDMLRRERDELLSLNRALTKDAEDVDCTGDSIRPTAKEGSDERDVHAAEKGS